MCNYKGMGKQKLSPRAAAAKKKRDLAYAKTPRRTAMKAENQRKRRKAGAAANGKDYDHRTRSFKSVKYNRGNNGNGTKKEGPKKK